MSLRSIAIAYFFSVAIFAMAVVFPIPSNIGLEFRYGISIAAISGTLFLFASYFSTGLLGTFLSLSTTFVLFSIPLTALWTSGVSEPTIIGGLLPWSDARQYLESALQLLSGSSLTPETSKRPLFPSFVAIILAATQQNLKITLAIIVAINAFCCYLLAREIRTSYGTIAAVGVILIAFFFYRRFSGTFLTENLGFAFGALALTLLWRGAILQKQMLFFFGLFLLTVGLTARAGAFFTLPILLIWGCWRFSRQSHSKINPLIIFLTAILLGFALNTLTGSIVNPDGLRSTGGFGHTLYGQVVGGKGWTQVAKDHPNADSSQYISLALEAFRDNPMGLAKGIMSSYSDYFDWDKGAFGFGFIRNNDSDSLHLHLRRFLCILGLIGFFFSCYFWRRVELSLLVSATFGVLFSVPFIPPIDADGLRVYAATIPMTAMFPVLLTSELITRFYQNIVGPSVPHLKLDTPPSVLIATGILLSLSCSLAPIILKSASYIAPQSLYSCDLASPTPPIFSSNEKALYLEPNELSSVTRSPHIRIADFRAGLDGLSQYPTVVRQLKQLPSTTTLLFGSTETINSDPRSLLTIAPLVFCTFQHGHYQSTLRF